MATGTAASPAVDDWKDVPADDWKDVSGTPIRDKSSLRTETPTDWTGSAPVSDFIHKKLAPIENYNEAGRAEHPILSRIGDVARKLPITLPTQQKDQVYDQPIFPMGGPALSLAEEAAPAMATPAAEAVVPQGPPVPIPTPRRVPGEVPRDIIAQAPAERVSPIAAKSGESQLPGGGVLRRGPAGLLPAAPEPTVAPSPIIQNAVRRGPGEIAPERVSSTAPQRAMNVPAIAQQTGESQLPGGGVIQRPAKMLSAGGPIEAPAEIPKTSIRSIANQVVDQNIPTPKLQPSVPLRAQPSLTRGTPGSRAAMDVGEEFGSRVKAPEKLPTAITEEVGNQAGAPPLKPNVSLREQIQNPEAPATESNQARLERMYPDKGMRQLVHIVGEDMAQAVGGDKALAKAVADLRGPEVRQAAINLGEDMGQTSVGSRKAVGDQARPQEILSRLLKKGHTPSEIIAAAKKPTKP